MRRKRTKSTKWHKWCPSCKSMKSKSFFNKHSSRHDGLQSNCRDCMHMKQKEWSKTPRGNSKLQKYRKKHRKKLLEYGKQYRKTNRKELSRKEAERLKYDINFKIRKLMRYIVIGAIKRVSKNNCKYSSTITQIGCTDTFFRDHIESQFQKGMTWDNHGKWHVDHIIPCSKFDLTDPAQQKLCNHYSNLQPLWAKDNLKKSNKE